MMVFGHVVVPMPEGVMRHWLLGGLKALCALVLFGVGTCVFAGIDPDTGRIEGFVPVVVQPGPGPFFKNRFGLTSQTIKADTKYYWTITYAVQDENGKNGNGGDPKNADWVLYYASSDGTPIIGGSIDTTQPLYTSYFYSPKKFNPTASDPNLTHE